MRHDQLDVFALNAGLIHLLTIIFFVIFLFLSVTCIYRLALAGIRVVVPCVLTSIGFGTGELCGSIGLCLRVEILNLGFAENAAFPLAESRVDG